MAADDDLLDQRNVDADHNFYATVDIKKADGRLTKNTAQRDRDTFIKAIFAAIASDIDFLSSFFSFGLDQGWRKRIISRLELKGGEKVLVPLTLMDVVQEGA